MTVTIFNSAKGCVVVNDVLIDPEKSVTFDTRVLALTMQGEKKRIATVKKSNVKAQIHVTVDDILKRCSGFFEEDDF